MRRLVRPLARHGVTPNQITTARLLAGVGGAGVYALGLGMSALIGSALLLLSFLLDRLDGELARTTGATSPRGHKYDLIADATVNATVFAGAGIGLGATALDGRGPMLGLIAAAGVVAALALVTLVERHHGPRAAEIRTGGHFDPDDAMVLVPLLVLAGAQAALVAVAAAATPVTALALAWHLRRKLHRHGPARGAEVGD